MNLQNLNVAELSAQEVRETEGGILPLLVVGACLLLTGCVTVNVGDGNCNNSNNGQATDSGNNNGNSDSSGSSSD